MALDGSGSWGGRCAVGLGRLIAAFERMWFGGRRSRQARLERLDLVPDRRATCGRHNLLRCDYEGEY